MTMLIAVLALGACTENPVERSATEMLADSEQCRAATAEDMSRARASLKLSSDRIIRAYNDGYRACMSERGYTLPRSTYQ
jgi:hypothetical protein